MLPVSLPSAPHANGVADTLVMARCTATELSRSCMLDATRIAALHDLATNQWHTAGLPGPAARNPLEELVLAQHRANFDLWHQEDEARDPDAADREIARVKRAIDRINQCRNDLAERVDALLLELAPGQNAQAILHSETPGLIVDRLSILSLKLFHTAEQTERTDVEELHRTRNRDRLVILATQRDDLTRCLAQLWADILAGRRRFKLYRQLKMYNDPTLNPVLYRTQAKG